jgi:hypothetical protein
MFTINVEGKYSVVGIPVEFYLYIKVTHTSSGEAVFLQVEVCEDTYNDSTAPVIEVSSVPL